MTVLIIDSNLRTALASGQLCWWGCNCFSVLINPNKHVAILLLVLVFTLDPRQGLCHWKNWFIQTRYHSWNCATFETWSGELVKKGCPWYSVFGKAGVITAHMCAMSLTSCNKAKNWIWILENIAFNRHAHAALQQRIRAFRAYVRVVDVHDPEFKRYKCCKTNFHNFQYKATSHCHQPNAFLNGSITGFRS